MLANRVKETTSTTGTGNITLAGAVAGFQSFNTAFGTNRRFTYWLVNDTDNEWETGIGYLSASTTLVREKVLNSTNSDAAVNFTTAPSVFVDASVVDTANAALGFDNTGASSYGKYFTPSNFAFRSSSSVALTANTIYYIPILLTRPMSINRIALKVVTGSGAGTDNLYAGVYDVDPDTGLPGYLLVSATDIDPSSSSVTAEGTCTETLLQAGWYYVGVWSDVTPTLRANADSNTMPHPFTSFTTNALHLDTGLHSQSASSLSDLPTTAAASSFATSDIIVPLLGHS